MRFSLSVTDPAGLKHEIGQGKPSGNVTYRYSIFPVQFPVTATSRPMPAVQPISRLLWTTPPDDARLSPRARPPVPYRRTRSKAYPARRRPELNHGAKVWQVGPGAIAAQPALLMLPLIEL